jgi:hypothetical protein
MDPATGADGLRKSLAERYTEVLDGVMLVDVEVAAGIDPEVERAMPREQLEHVIQESDPRPDAVATLTLEAQAHLNLRLLGSTID